MLKNLTSVVSCAALILLNAVSIFAQCDCDFIIPLDASVYVIDGNTLRGVNGQVGVRPGDKICLASGTRPDLMIVNMRGTAAAPILITNMCDGRVTIRGTSVNTGRLMYIGNCSFLRVSGAGNANVQYGIEMTVGIQGLDFRDLSTDVEGDHLYVHDISYSALNAKTDPTCDPATWRGNFTMRNISFHDNLVRYILGEGVYIGESHYHTTVPVTCNGVVTQQQEHEVIGAKVYNNIFENIGRDAIQMGSVTSGGEIHHNKIVNFGTTNEFGQQSGIQINPGTNAKIYDNVVDTGTGFGLFAGGRGGSHVYNNIIANCQQGAIICADYAPVDPSGFIFSNNTLVNNRAYGIDMFSQNTLQNQFVNNIVVGTTEAGYQFVNLRHASIRWTDTNNIKTQTISTVKFVNTTTKDWHLQSSSPARDAGKDMRTYGINKDLEDTPRPQGPAFDIGAYEYKGNAAPVANAGSDRTITLPTNSLSIAGSATDADGTVMYWEWTKVSGGAATLTNIGNPTVSISNLVAGTYTFRLKVTDNLGAVGTDDVVVTVRTSGNSAPVANAGADRTIHMPVNFLSIAGSATDADGTVMYWEWTKVSGGAATLANANTATVNITGLVAGVYTFRLKVTDNLGAVGTDDVSVRVNAAPVANAGSDRTITLPTNSLSIAGSATDADGTVMYWEWTKVSGGAATLTNAGSPTLSVSGLVAGTYTFSLKVTDNLGGLGTDQMTVTVRSASSARAAEEEAAGTNPANAPVNEAPLNGTTAEQEFTFLDKRFPGGHTYFVVIFDEIGGRIYAGPWRADTHKDVFVRGRLYIYHIMQDGINIGKGKVVLSR